MYPKLLQTIELLKNQEISEDRKAILAPLVDFIQKRLEEQKEVSINFICTHNSRRSHLSQVWAQIASAYYDVPNVTCYSGGTEETAMFSKVVETLNEQGLSIIKISNTENPVYALKYDEDKHPIIGFSKRYDSSFNPMHGFVAIMTCSQADGGCPFIAGADKRIPITFEDPKVSDNTPEQTKVYLERSLQIGAEMFYIFSQIKK
ncbi:protein-tyrosine-phosphatase [Elizabethkingia anophelis]|uniref:arsenate-mycothiol transferase ArsC n=1 Tax=Weeksellaceae TaxID=2762318 RepID=UPI0009999393|nr:MULTISPECIES: protein-tyrosine-phosphatase [Weeksellaceae]MDV3550267.1 protein-tyrosine-phosphatase [Elizabethkingia anophelis]MDV3565222.1 protein-tyrosine-phosphatase [Elizabethkingia anophelis]MDV3612196.1 protein-tyrosine-phosphatase [Elizabethkingia anophelis]MDV3626636.1 protein-tyrosine-phosphatase [Elizabethkingia anophelis]MDV3644281.1 protein-tyrosine-phosphatase [Elizabethkingia anophelis]